MANIRGISIKTVKHFIGTEGPAYQGNIYIGSKKVAFWSQDGNGGPDWFDMMNGFSKKKLVEAKIYEEIEPHKKTQGNPHWKAKVRQTLQMLAKTGSATHVSYGKWCVA